MYQPEIPEVLKPAVMPVHFLRALDRLLYASGMAPLRSTHTLFARCAAGDSDRGEVNPYSRLPARIGRVVVFIEEHLEEPLSLDRMAGEANLSKYHFSRLFREEVGQTPWAYVREARIEKAKTHRSLEFGGSSKNGPISLSRKNLAQREKGDLRSDDSPESAIRQTRYRET